MGEPALRTIVLTVCQPCLDGVGSECHTPGCALWMHRVDLPIRPEVYQELEQVGWLYATAQRLDGRYTLCRDEPTAHRHRQPVYRLTDSEAHHG